jgi:serine/arginine repetitive matrix protein 2
LFLFTDILVIAEPTVLGGEEVLEGVEGTFHVKSVVPLETLVAQRCHGKMARPPFNTVPYIAEFREQFSLDPDRSVDRLSEQTRIAQDSAALAEILFDSHEFDKEQLADYLAQSRNRALLDEYIRQFNFAGVRIDHALRVYILALRLPPDNAGFESILQAFAKGWYQANISTIEFGLNTVRNLVLFIMKLHDGYHKESTFGFAREEAVVSSDEFIADFYEQDRARVVPESLLKTVYAAVRQEKYVQAASALENRKRGRIIETSLMSEELWLPAGEWSKAVTVTIPAIDPHLTIRLLGDGLSFDTDLLQFDKSRQQSFRVKGLVPGRFKMLFSRSGGNA